MNTIKKALLLLICITSIATFGACHPNISPTSSDPITYEITEVGGKYYLNLSNGNQYKRDTDECIGMLPGYVRFASLKEMKEKFTQDKLTESEMDKIKLCLYCGDKNGIEIYNMNRLYEPVLPEDINIDGGVLLTGNDYAFMLTSKNDEHDSFICYPKYEYDDVFQDFYVDLLLNNDHVTITSKQNYEHRGFDAEIYNYRYNTSSATEGICIHYKIKDGDKTLYVEEDYVYGSRYSDLITPRGKIGHVSIYGEQEGGYFEYYLSDVDDDVLAEWISSFGIRAFDENRVVS